MKEGGLLGSGGGVVEADETYMTPVSRARAIPTSKRAIEDVVLGMVERGGQSSAYAYCRCEDGDDRAGIGEAHQPGRVLQTDKSRSTT